MAPRLGWRWLARLAGALGLAVGAWVVADRVWPLPSVAAPVSPLVEDRAGRPLRLFTAADGRWRLPAGPADVPEHYLALLTAFEDRRFRHHPGVDPLALARAARQAVVAGRVVSGGSTLTMQVARLIAPGPRGLATKLGQMFRATQLEARFTKDEILAVYLTRAPFGGNVEGVRAAAWTWFGKAAADLDLAEAALLVGLPQSPERLRPDRHAEAARGARAKVLDRAVALGLLAAADAAAAAIEPIPTRRHEPPFHAPHLAERLVRATGLPVVRTTLSLDAQRHVEAVARDALADLHPRANVAIIVADVTSRAVLAWVGGGDFFAEARAGMVDLARAPRSPGSTLKPLIYGMGFDDAVVHPGTLIEDRALAFGDWAPRNFDRRFHGAVTAAQALQMSLNLPAVAVLDRVGARRFASTLAVAGAPLRLPASDRPTGLAIGLGGGALGLADLVALYAAIADDGGVAPLRVLAGGPGAARLPVLSADAARAVFDILVGAPPTDGRAPAELLGDARRRAIKTGTSYGFRDAWAIGASRRHVVGVWVGRPDGTPSPGHYGRAIASPILNRVFDRLPPELDAAPSAGAGRFAGRPPPALARFGAHDRPLGVTRGDAPLVLTFPPAGAEFAAADIPHLGLRADGGRRPLRWLVDGRPLAADQPWRRETRWIPDGPGFYRLSVIDAEGASASATIRIH